MSRTQGTTLSSSAGRATSLNAEQVLGRALAERGIVVAYAVDLSAGQPDDEGCQRSGAGLGVRGDQVDELVRKLRRRGGLPVRPHLLPLEERIERRLHDPPRHRLRDVRQRRAQLAERLEDAHALLRIPDVDRRDDEALLIVHRRWKVLVLEERDRDCHAVDLVGSRLGVLTEAAQHRLRVLGWIEDAGEGHDRADRVQPEREARYDPEVAAAAAQGPVQVRILVGGRSQPARRPSPPRTRRRCRRTVRRPAQPAITAAEREAGDTRVRRRRRRESTARTAAPRDRRRPRARRPGRTRAFPSVDEHAVHRRAMTMPPSWRGRRRDGPPRTVTSMSRSRAKFTAATTSAVPSQRTTRPRRSAYIAPNDGRTSS